MIIDPTVFSSLVEMFCVQPNATAQWLVKQLLGYPRLWGLIFRTAKTNSSPIPKGWYSCWLDFCFVFVFVFLKI